MKWQKMNPACIWIVDDMRLIFQSSRSGEDIFCNPPSPQEGVPMKMYRLLSCFERNRKITGPSMVVKQQTSQHTAPFTAMDKPCYYKWCVHIMAGRKPPVKVGAGDAIEKGRKVTGLKTWRILDLNMLCTVWKKKLRHQMGILHEAGLGCNIFLSVKKGKKASEEVF